MRVNELPSQQINQVQWPMCVILYSGRLRFEVAPGQKTETFNEKNSRNKLKPKELESSLKWWSACLASARHGAQNPSVWGGETVIRLRL
jgi:hypothetical protein